MGTVPVATIDVDLAVVWTDGQRMTGETFMLTANIIRTEGSKPVLKPWERMENARAEGRFIFDVTPLTEWQ